MSLKKGTKDVSLLTKIPPNVKPKTITTNGAYVASDEGLDGYSEVEVATSGVDINEYMSDEISGGDVNVSGWMKLIKKLRNPLIVVGTSAAYMFDKFQGTNILQLDTSNVTSMEYMFRMCNNITNIPQLNTSKVTNMNNMFANCNKLETIPQLDTSNVTSMLQMFGWCYNLKEIPQLDTSNVTSMRNFCYFCRNNLKEIPQLDTSKVTDLYYAFAYCEKLMTIPKLNLQSAIDITSICSSCHNLENLGGFENLGMAYDITQKENYGYYGLYLNNATNLTEQSLINVLTNLYDIATKGVKPQKLVLGATNLAKLTSEEGQQALAQAQQFGWNVS